ncbi:hypothetical protein CC86DRAFT_210290 [Ophiobolus disseminans]|uniref:Uncharacterized protein n=1 Tax=Ophiobolus disseminans TaxID=1469910 RepID=A0A6A7A3M5_9PLEO|nr:hypothetical protein CC86DRAFT_210290 [Ophiobolus disseminans]
MSDVNVPFFYTGTHYIMTSDDGCTSNDEPSCWTSGSCSIVVHASLLDDPAAPVPPIDVKSWRRSDGEVTHHASTPRRFSRDVENAYGPRHTSRAISNVHSKDPSTRVECKHSTAITISRHTYGASPRGNFHIPVRDDIRATRSIWLSDQRTSEHKRSTYDPTDSTPRSTSGPCRSHEPPSSTQDLWALYDVDAPPQEETRIGASTTSAVTPTQSETSKNFEFPPN